MAQGLIYSPKGKAKEYIPDGFALNVYTGCTYGCTYCVDENTDVLLPDFSTKKIKDLKINETILGFDEFINEKFNHYKLKETTVLNITRTQKAGNNIVLKNGNSVIASDDHKFLTTNRGWKYVIGKMAGKNRRPYLTTNNSIYSFLKSHKAIIGEQYKLGYLSGMIRGDGHLKFYEYQRNIKAPNRKRSYLCNKKTYGFRLALNDKEAIKRTKEYLNFFGITVQEFDFNKKMKGIRSNKKETFDRIHQVIEYKESPGFYAGWIAGIFDAEGSNSGSLRIHNSDKKIISFTKKALNYYKFKYKISQRESVNKVILIITIQSTLLESARFFNMFNIAIKRKIPNTYKNHDLPLASKVEKIVPTGIIHTMYDITTTSGTFFANGLAAHNCYAPRIMHEERELYHTAASPRKRFRERLFKELPLYKGKKVFLSFISDPFQPCEEEYKMTEFVLAEMLVCGVIPVILTKGIVSDKVFEIICSFEEAYFGCTLTSVDNDVALTWEPKAPLASLRMDQIKRFHDRNVNTWVSLEPVIYPGEALEVIEKTHNYVDEYKIGKLNYENIGEKIDWKKFVDQAINLCEKYGVTYYIKNSLKEYLEI